MTIARVDAACADEVIVGTFGSERQDAVDQPPGDGDLGGEPAEEEPSLARNPSLEQLRRDLNDDVAVDNFVADFLDLLDIRLTGLQRLLQRGRIEDAVTALLTIETSGLMVGADDLADAAAELRRAVGVANTARVPALLERLTEVCEQTKRRFGRR